MTSVRPQPAFAPVACALREALETVTTRPVSEALIAQALRTSGLPAIPEAGPTVLAFAEGALLTALSERVGDVASDVLDQLRPVLERAALREWDAPVAPVRLAAIELRSNRPSNDATADDESGIYHARRLRTESAPSAPPPVIFLASRDPEAAAALAHALGGRMVVRTVDGLLDLLEALDEELDARCALVFDASEPSVQVRSLLTIAPELTERTKVIVWRAVEDARAALANAAAAASWRHCSIDDVPELARVCTYALS